MAVNQPRAPRPTTPPRPRFEARKLTPSVAVGRHWPEPVLVSGVWRCADCRWRLRWYETPNAEWRLRHYRP